MLPSVKIIACGQTQHWGKCRLAHAWSLRSLESVMCNDGPGEVVSDNNSWECSELSMSQQWRGSKPKYGKQNNPNLLSNVSNTVIFVWEKLFFRNLWCCAVKFYFILLPLGLFTTIAAIKPKSVHQISISRIWEKTLTYKALFLIFPIVVLGEALINHT